MKLSRRTQIRVAQIAAAAAADAVGKMKRIRAAVDREAEEFRDELTALLCFVKIDGDTDIVARRVSLPPALFERRLADGIDLLREHPEFYALFHRLRAAL